jgi:hypothetical protein
MATHIIPHLDRQAEDALEAMVDKFGLENVLDSLACICSGKADHIEHNWQDQCLAKYWYKSALHLMDAAGQTAIKVVS